ncbi:hypothetical protein KUTeg_010843 [Tegillarca granosa]|uniref:ATP-dependent DNA helicase n=1 Tax=Tegillarca granosa TaxID=220873 RepID=A0ABQ9F7A2_TEGGR|nr:hypothetical protein KUTeg_010843 [Tegillarca granosa]
MALTKTQQEILDKAKEGHSLLILGQSGTGKSYLVKEISRILSREGKAVSITASTGIASLNVNGQTIHSWSGIGDGRFSNDEIIYKINTDEHFKKYKSNILATNCLIIDEISMLSLKLFDQIEYICRNIVQVILYLAVYKGDLPRETHDLLCRLGRPLPPGPEPIRLCARTFDCFMYNAMKLIDLDADEIVYNAVDDGDVSKLEKLPVPKTLHLKTGCPVMLLKNLSVKLVNGLRGTVTGMSSNGVTVNFIGSNSENLTTNLKPELFSVYSCNDGKGLTLHRVEVDATNIFVAGQLGVAIGRATEKKELRVLGFNESSVLKHDPALYQFYKNTDAKDFDIQGKLDCCRVVNSCSESIKQHSVSESETEELSDFSDNEMSEIDFLLSPDSEPDDLNFFVNKLYSEIKDIFVKICGNVLQKPTEPKTWTKYYSAVYQFSTSDVYVSLVKSLFQCEILSPHFEICSKIFDKVTSEVLKRHSDALTLKRPSTSSLTEMSDSSKGKLRVNIEDANNCLHELFKDLIEKFCRIADNEFRKKMLHVLQKTKTECLRKRVDLTQNVCSTLTMKNIFEDKSDRRQGSHLKLKSLIFDFGISCLHTFTKKDLLRLIIPSSDNIRYPQHLNECGLVEKTPSPHWPLLQNIPYPVSHHHHQSSSALEQADSSRTTKKNLKSRKRKPQKSRFTKKKSKEREKMK